MKRRQSKKRPTKKPAPKKRPTKKPAPKKRPTKKPAPKKPAPKKRPTKKPAPKKRPTKKPAPKKHPPRRPPSRRPQPRAPGLHLTRRATPAGTPLCESLVLVITGASRLGLLREASTVLSALDRHLRPVASRSSVSAYSSEWVWRKRPVDAYTVLPALAHVAPEMAVPSSARFSFGVILESGEYLSLAHDSVTLGASLGESNAFRAYNAARYISHRPTSRSKPRARRAFALEAA